MAYIYKIQNLLNGKVYIGKTEYNNPLKRFNEHLQQRFATPERPLYRAMNKYGVDNFSFEVIEETNSPDEREIFWIEHYNSYSGDGYNATRGGEGTRILNYEEIIKDFLELNNISKVAKKHNCQWISVANILKNSGIQKEKKQKEKSKQIKNINHQKIVNDYLEIRNASEVARQNDCHIDSVFRILKENGIERDSAEKVTKKVLSKKVEQYSLDGKLLNEFDSILDAAIFLGKKEKRNHISAVCNGKRKTAYGFVWKFK